MKKIFLQFLLLQLCFEMADANETKKQHLTFIKSIWKKEASENFGYRKDIELTNSASIKRLGTAICQKQELFGVFLSELGQKINDINISSMYNGGSAGRVYMLYGHSRENFTMLYIGPLRGINKILTKRDCPEIEVSLHPVLGGIGILRFTKGKYELLQFN